MLSTLSRRSALATKTSIFGRRAMSSKPVARLAFISNQLNTTWPCSSVRPKTCVGTPELEGFCKIERVFSSCARRKACTPRCVPAAFSLRVPLTLPAYGNYVSCRAECVLMRISDLERASESTSPANLPH